MYKIDNFRKSGVMSLESVRRQSIITIFFQIAITLLGFVSTMFFAHTVGASVLGSYFLFLAYFGILTLFGDYGLGGAAIKRISEGSDQNAYFTALVTLRSILFTVLVLTLLIFRDLFVDLNKTGMFYWLLAALALVVFKGSIGYGNVACSKLGVHSTAEFIDRAFCLIVQVVAVYFGFGAAGLAGGFAAGMIISGLFGLRFLDLRFARFGIIHLKSLFRFAFWGFLTTSGSLVFTQADTVLVGYFLDNVDVGIYRVALSLTLIATFTTSATRQVLYPRVSRWGKTNEFGLVEESLKRAFTYSLLLAVPVFAGGIALSDKLLYYFYGAEFARGSIVLAILLAVQVVNVFQSIFTAYLGGLDHPKDVFKVTIITALINIILDILLIPLFGIEGAAIATLITMSLNALFAWVILSKLISVRIEKNSLLNILIATVFMIVFIIGYRSFVAISSIWLIFLPIALGGIIYTLMLLKLDKNIHNDMKNIVVQLGLPWPEWL